jgi:hypothetical protein
MKNFRDWLVRAGFGRVGWVWIVHPNKMNDGNHIHVLANCAVPAAIIRNAGVGVGFGPSMDVRPFTRTRSGTEYPFHHLIDRGSTPDVRIDLDRHLGRDGGWLIHSAGPFWKTPDGFPLAGRKEAIKVMLRDRSKRR